MKAVVIKRFIDKYKKTVHPVGTVYEGDAKRIEELKQLGFLADGETAEKSPLDANAQEAIAQIHEKMGENELNSLLEQEKAGKNRQTVIKHIENLLSRLKEKA